MTTYGDTLDAIGLGEFIKFFLEMSFENEGRTGERPTPLCIWGLHGIGKTASIVDFARSNGWKLAYCAPAQFEEVGDLIGMPMRVDPDPAKRGDEYTAYAPPDWVPQEEGPGILLLDDINRADDRILRSLMQLLQNFEMFSWSLPKKWQIVCTANPEDAEYSTTPMDDAMLTRMLHVTLRFDAKAWAAWATKAGVDPRGIDFVLTYPEVVTGKRTTPRSLAQVFALLVHLPDLKVNLQQVATIARGGLDEVTVKALLAYVNDELGQMVGAAEILEADPFGPVKERIAVAGRGKGGTVRLDRLSAIGTRLVLELGKPKYENPSSLHKRNVVALLQMPELPADLRFALHKDIVLLPGRRPELVQDPALARLVLKTV